MLTVEFTMMGIPCLDLSWQITPRALTDAMAGPDRAVAKRVFEAMKEMGKNRHRKNRSRQARLM